MYTRNQCFLSQLVHYRAHSGRHCKYSAYVAEALVVVVVGPQIDPVELACLARQFGLGEEHHQFLTLPLTPEDWVFAHCEILHSI